MEPTPEANEPDRERLRSVTITYAGFQGLGVCIAGLLIALYGTIYLLSQHASRLAAQPIWFTIVMAGMFLVPRLVSRFYYRPKFGYVKALSPNPSWRTIGLITSAFALFIFLMFAAGDYASSHSLEFAFEPLTFLLGVGFLAIAFSCLGRPQYRPYQSLAAGVVLLAIAFLPVVHLQTKEQVFNGWLWVAFGIMSVISGFRSHRFLIRSLTPNKAGRDHA
jgi:hypothetical protein